MAFLERSGFSGIDVDIVNSSDQPMDLSDDNTWTTYINTLDSFDGVGIATVCSTFSRARKHGPGPRQLRSKSKPYGFDRKYYSAEEYKELRLGTYFALMSIKVFKLCMQKGIPVFLENPEPWDENAVSIWDLDEYVQVRGHPAVRTWDFDQCTHGAYSTKPTRLITFGLDLSGILGRCTHSPQEWHFTDSRGNWTSTWAAHAPLVGRKVDGAWASKASASYPGRMNEIIAQAFGQATSS